MADCKLEPRQPRLGDDPPGFAVVQNHSITLSRITRINDHVESTCLECCKHGSNNRCAARQPKCNGPILISRTGLRKILVAGLTEHCKPICRCKTARRRLTGSCQRPSDRDHRHGRHHRHLSTFRMDDPYHRPVGSYRPPVGSCHRLAWLPVV